MGTVFSREMALFGYRFVLSIQVRGEGLRRLSARNEKIVKEYEEGISIGEISVRHDLTPGRVSQILGEHGAREPRWNRMTNRQRRLVLKLGRKGLSKSEIGRRVGISRTRVRQILRDGGFEADGPVEGRSVGVVSE